jgi:hypothetical protein
MAPSPRCPDSNCYSLIVERISQRLQYRNVFNGARNFARMVLRRAGALPGVEPASKR